jgi:hypothetical protein
MQEREGPSSKCGVRRSVLRYCPAYARASKTENLVTIRRSIRGHLATALRFTSPCCSSSQTRFLASRRSAVSGGTPMGPTPSSLPAFWNEFARQDSPDPDVIRDLAHCHFELVSNHGNIASELRRVRDWHVDILIARTNLHRSGVIQTAAVSSARLRILTEIFGVNVLLLSGSLNTTALLRFLTR